MISHAVDLCREEADALYNSGRVYFFEPLLGNPVTLSSVVFDKAFFRNYKNLKPETKHQLLEILKTLKKTQG